MHLTGIRNKIYHAALKYGRDEPFTAERIAKSILKPKAVVSMALKSLKRDGIFETKMNGHYMIRPDVRKGLSAEDRAMIKVLVLFEGMTLVSVAEKFEVSATTIGRIANSGH